jgi:hypothetical protein
MRVSFIMYCDLASSTSHCNHLKLLDRSPGNQKHVADRGLTVASCYLKKFPFCFFFVLISEILFIILG